MGEIFKLFGTIGVDNGEANSALDQTEAKGQSVTGKLVGFFKKAAVAIATVFAVDKIIDFGKMSVEAAASAQALSAQFSQVFGKLEPLAQKTVEKMGDKMNILPNRIKPTFSKITSMFKGLGMDTETAMKKSEQATTLAADAAAFYDVSLEDASGSLTSFLKGNYEAGESIGVFANDTQMAQFAISKGVVGSTKDWQNLDEATKQATRLEYAQNMLQQAGAVGQAAREGDGYENVMGNLKQAWQDFLAVVGSPILGTVVGVIQQITGKLQDVGKELPNVFNGMQQFWNTNAKASPLISTITRLKDSVVFFANILKQRIFGLFENDSSNVSQLLSNLSKVFKDLAEGAVMLLFQNVSTLASILATVVPTAIELVAGVLTHLSDIFAPLIVDVVDFGAKISEHVGMVINEEILPAIEDFTDMLSENKGIIDGVTSVLVTAGTAFLTYKGIVTGIKVAQEAYNVVMFATTLMTKGLNAATIAMAGAQGASTLALNLNVAAVKAATFAQRALNLVMSANPFMLIVTALVALAAGFIYLWKTNEDFRNKVIEIWTIVKEKAIEIFNAVAEFLTGVWTGIVDAVIGFKDSVIEIWTSIKNKVTEIFSAIAEFLSTIWSSIVSVAITVWNVFYAVIGGIILSTVNIIKGIFEGLRIYLGILWDGIKAVALAVWGLIGNQVMAIIQGFINFWVNIFTVFANGLSNIWNGIRNVATTVWNLIKTGVITIAQTIVNMVLPIFQAFSNTITSIWNGIRNIASTVWNAIKSVITSVVQAVVNTVVPIFNGLKNTVSNIFNGIRNVASTVWNAIKSTISSVVSSIVSVATSLFNGLKNTISSIWNGIHSVISGIVSGVKNTVSSVWGGLVGIVSGVFNGVRSAIEGPMNTAKNFISGIINTIKGFFNFSISWPKIPLPHFSISPAGWSVGDLLKGKIPSLGIDWYAKGGILTQPTAFGMNGNNLMVGGEAGAEAVAPIDTLLGYVRTAVHEVVGDQKEGDIYVTQYITSPEPLTPREIARETKLKLQDLAVLKK